MGSHEPVIIEDVELLRKLAKVIYYQEVDAIKDIRFASEPDQAKYLQDIKSNYDTVLSFLDAGETLKARHKKDEVRSTIANDVFSFIVRSSNSALQSVKNFSLRKNYLSKIRAHSEVLIGKVDTLNTSVAAEVEALAQDAVGYRNAMLDATRMNQSPSSQAFSRWIKESGLPFEELLKRYQTKRGFAGEFRDLQPIKKIEVYNEIIKASGRGNIRINRLSAAMGATGFAVLLFAIGTMVWDIFTSDHILQTAVRDSVVLAASIGGAMAGEVVGAALATNLLVGVEASALFVMVAGILGGIAGAFIFGALAGWLIDLIIGSGGSAPLSTEGRHVYVATLPDGAVLARQLAHQQI